MFSFQCSYLLHPQLFVNSADTHVQIDLLTGLSLKEKEKNE